MEGEGGGGGGGGNQVQYVDYAAQYVYKGMSLLIVCGV